MISIIVPCYNVVEYLERCVESLVEQTYKDIEIILVNDGSTDKTGELCNRLTEKDTRIRVLHKENGGLSDARNAGIDAARGDFYAFVDGDDYVEPDAYEAMVAEMEDKAVGIVSAGIRAVEVDGSENLIMSPRKRVLSREEAFINLLGNERTIGQSSCNKLFRRELFTHLRYKKGIVNEDTQLLPSLLDLCEKVVLLDKIVYHYIKRNGSITVSKFSMWKYKGIEIADETLVFCKKKYPNLVPYAYYYKMDALFKMYREILISSNRVEFKKQEYILRVKLLKTCFICYMQKMMRQEFGIKVKNVAITAFLGDELTKAIVEMRQRS